MPFLSDYACKVCLQHLSKISLYEARFLLPPSSCHLGIPPGRGILYNTLLNYPKRSLIVVQFGTCLSLKKGHGL
jgi:hypothetical protein